MDVTSFVDVIPPVAQWVAVVYLGLVLGSFATALAYRVPRSIPWIFEQKKKNASAARSKCPNCKHSLGLFDLIPVISWVMQGGKCRYCKERISPIYPITELATTVLCCLSFWFYGMSLPFLFVVCAIPFLVALAVIDLQFYLLPDQLVLITGICGVLFVASQFFFGAWQTDPVWDFMMRLLSGVIYGGVAYLLHWGGQKLLKKDALGLGDVKFFAVAGVWLGLQAFPFFLAVAGISGMILSVIWLAITGSRQFPFGPSLILALLCGLFLPDPLIYLGII